MEPPGGVPPDRERQLLLKSQQQQQQQQQQMVTFHDSPSATSGGNGNGNGGGDHAAAAHGTKAISPALASTATAYSATTQAATAFSGTSIGHALIKHHQTHHAAAQSVVSSTVSSPAQHAATGSGAAGGSVASYHSSSSTASSAITAQQTIEKLSRPMAFDKMEALVREMQDPEHGVPVRQQKMFLTSIPYAFMGYDLIEWLMDRLLIEESEALNIANQLCLHGYFFPVNDSKTLTVKDDSSLYRFQTPYYWPWQHKAPDNVEYAIYLVKRSLRNKQRHALEDYEVEALASLHKNLKGKWEIISMQAEEQVRLAKERKKGEKIVGDSQERAYWRVHRPPPGQFTPLEPCPVPSRDRQGTKQNKKKTTEDMQRDVDYLKKSFTRTRMKMSQACESLVTYSETFSDYDFFLQPVLPSNPWVTEDITFWQLNNTFVDIPTEKRVKRWAISIEELVSDPTGLQEFTTFLEKEYSHENIRFWIAVNRLRRSSHSQVAKKVQEIYEEFLKPGAPCEINIDGKTMESVLKGLKNPSRFTFDSASEHIYMLLLKKDCYPRFIRSEHYKRLLETGIQPAHKKRFFNFGGVSGAKKKMTAALSSQPNLGANVDMSGSGSRSSANASLMMTGASSGAPPPGSLSRRRGSDRSLSGSAHELAIICVNKDANSKVPHSHSQSNLSEIPYRDAGKSKPVRLETTVETAGASAVCPWDIPDEPPTTQAPTKPAVKEVAAPKAPAAAAVKLSICPWEQDDSGGEIEVTVPAMKTSAQRLTSTSSDNTEVCERLQQQQRNLGIRHQNTVDSGEAGVKRLIPNFTEQRRASVSFSPSRLSEFPTGRPSTAKISTTPSPTVGTKPVPFPALFAPLQGAQYATAAVAAMAGNTKTSKTSAAVMVSKDPPSASSDAEVEEELQKLMLNKAEQTTDLPALVTPTPTPPNSAKLTPTPPAVVATVTDTELERETPNSEKRQSSTSDKSVNASEEEEEPEPEDEAIAEAEAEAEETGDSDKDNQEELDAEVDSEVQEVQIELIETSEGYQKLCESQDDVDMSPPPIIQIEGEEEKEPKEEEQQEEEEEEQEQDKSTTALPENADALSQHSQDKEVEEINRESSSQNISKLETRPAKLESPSPLDKDEQIPTPQPKLSSQTIDLAAQQLAAAADELSPTTDEYTEFEVGADRNDYDIADNDSNIGYIPPAPTPAPSMAPLAEMDTDTVDDEPISEELKLNETLSAEKTLKLPLASNIPKITTEDGKKKRKKRHVEGKHKSNPPEDKEKASTSAAVLATPSGMTVEGNVAGVTIVTGTTANATALSKDAGQGNATKSTTETDLTTVCPWEDENVTTSDGTFTKTYATLGYL